MIVLIFNLRQNNINQIYINKNNNNNYIQYLYLFIKKLKITNK